MVKRRLLHIWTTHALLGLEFSRLDGKVDLAVIAQVRWGLCELSVLGGQGLGLASHFHVIAAKSVIQRSATASTTAAVNFQENFVKQHIGIHIYRYVIAKKHNNILAGNILTAPQTGLEIPETIHKQPASDTNAQ